MWMMMLEMLAAAGIALWLQQKFFQIYSRRGLSAEVYFDEEELNAGEKCRGYRPLPCQTYGNIGSDLFCILYQRADSQ